MLQEMYYWLMYFLKKIGKTDMFEFNSYLLICMLAGFNILTIIMIVSYLFGINVRTSFLQENSKTIGILFGLSVIAFNYFHLFKQRKNIVEKYSQLSGKRKIQGQIAFWIYSIASLFLMFFIGVNLFPSEL